MRGARWIAGGGVAAGVFGLAWWVFVSNPPLARTTPAAAERLRPQGDTYAIALGGPPRNLNPLTTVEQVALRAVLKYSHDALMDVDPRDASPRLALAEHVDSSHPDRRTHVVTLRQGVEFADGTPVTLDDVLFTWEVARDPEVAMGSIGEATDLVESVERLDDRRARFVLKQVTFAALPAFATNWLVVQKRHFIAAVRQLAAEDGVPAPAGPGAAGFGRLLLKVQTSGPGTGPYQLEPRASNPQMLTLGRNPRCWRLRAQPECWNLDAIRYTFAADAASQLAAARRQEIDLKLERDPVGLLAGDPELARHFRAQVYANQRNGHLMLLWNCRKPELARGEVRRALSWLADREAIARVAFGGHARAAAGWFRPDSDCYPTFAPDPFDPERARAQLQRAGAAGLRLVCMLDPKSDVLRKTFAILRDGFEKGGVELVELAIAEDQLRLEKEKGEFDAVLVFQSHEPWIDPYHELHSSQRERGGNYGGFADPEADRLLEQARQELEPQRRAGLYLRLGEVIRDQQPVTLLVHPLVSVIVHRRFEDAEPGALGLVPERWWVPRHVQLR